MKEKRKLNKGGKILLLFTLVVSSIFLLWPFTVKADINVNINKETQIVTDLISTASIILEMQTFSGFMVIMKIIIIMKW